MGEKEFLTTAKRKNVCKVMLTWMLMLLCCPLPVFASGHTTVENHGSIGAVDITLAYQVDEDTSAVLPNQEVAIKSTVTNIAEPAWLRMKIQYPVFQNEQVLEHLAELNLTELDDSLITFARNDWKKIDAYYYLEQPIKTGDVVDFTDAIRFPGDWDNNLVKSKFGIRITAEAIQEKNFTPDFKSEDPWFGAVIEEYESTDYMTKAQGNNRFSVIYEGGAEGMVKTEEDFFLNWETFMPGDFIEQDAQIQNNMDIPVKIYFSMKSNLGVDERTESLLRTLHMEIKHGDDVIYDGNLMDEKREILLKEYAPGESKTFSYNLDIPAELANDYAQIDFQTIWTFRAQESPKADVPEIVKTGRAFFAVAGIVIMASAALIGLHNGRKHPKR